MFDKIFDAMYDDVKNNVKNNIKNRFDDAITTQKDDITDDVIDDITNIVADDIINNVTNKISIARITEKNIDFDVQLLIILHYFSNDFAKNDFVNIKIEISYQKRNFFVEENYCCI